MGLLAPWFLAGLAAVGLPVWLHLLRQHRTTPFRFASLMFFERRTQSSIKHRRLRYLLLFALRALVLVLLALAFANPFVKQAVPAGDGGRKLVVLAVDNSFSMRQGDRLTRAKQAAGGIVSSMRSEDRAQVLAFASSVRLMSDQTNDAAALRAGIQSIEGSDERGSYAELARALRSLAQAARVPVQLHLFSDFQKSAMPPSFADMRLAEGIELTPHPVANAALANLAVQNVNAPRRVFDPKRVRVQATVASFAGEPATRRVALLLNGREVQSKDVAIPAGGRATVDFAAPEMQYGANRGEIRIDSGDRFTEDDRFYFSLERTEPRRALFVHESRNTRALLYFRAALDSSAEGAFQLDAVTPEQAAGISPEQHAFVVLSDLGGIPASFETALRAYVRAGGSVLLSLGRTSGLKSRVPIFDEPVLEALYAGRDGERFQTVSYTDAAHPSIPEGAALTEVKYYQTVRIQPGKARVAARLSDETPLLLEKKVGEGRVLVFASTFDNISNDFPLHPSFVPFIDQTCRYLGQLEQAGAVHTVGSFLELGSGRDASANIEVLDPNGARVFSLAEAAKAKSVQFTRAGYYQVNRPNGKADLVAVNADRHESDFSIMPAETLDLWRNTGTAASGSGGAAASEERAVPYGWYLLLAILALAAAESIVGNRHLNVEKEPA